MTQLPILPYPDAHTGATAGHSGSDTSRRLAENAAERGEIKGQQQIALNLLEQLAEHGITWTELLSEFWANGYLNAHHGAASRTLSNLHRAQLICRLAETRHDRKIYVLPQHTNNRPTEQPRPQKQGDTITLTEDERNALHDIRRQTDGGGMVYLDDQLLDTLDTILEKLGA